MGARVTARMNRGISRRSCQSALGKSNWSLKEPQGGGLAPSTGTLHTDLRDPPGSRHRLQGQVREGRLPGSRHSTGRRRPRVSSGTREPVSAVAL
jgi:hypothetical protein